MPAAVEEPAKQGAPPQQQWRPRHNPWLIAITVTLATFMEVLDTSIANVALPHIAGDLGAGQDESTWVLTSYLVANAVVLPLSAWLSTLFGRKRFYIGCVILFTLSSALCGLAPSLGMLVLFRVLQGVGGGGLQPSEQAILADTFPPHQRGMAFAVYGVAVVTAPAIGPTLGGWITDNFDWRWIFFINVPVGIFSVIMSSRLVEDPPYLAEQQKKRGFRIDYIGIGLLALGLGFLQVILDKGEREDWFDSNFIIACSIVSVLGIIGAAIWEWNHDAPAVDLKLLAERNFAVANLLMFMLGFVLLGSTVLLPLFAQTMLGYSATDAGLVISPGGFMVMVLMPLVGFLLGKVQARYMIAFGLCVTAAALWHMTTFNLDVNYRYLAMARVYQAAGLAFLFVPINTVSYAFVPRDRNNNASALINLARNMGGSVGIAFVTTLLSRRQQVHINQMVSNLHPGNLSYQQGLDQMTRALDRYHSYTGDASRQAQTLLNNTINRQAMMLAFLDCFWILSIAFACMIPLAFLLKKNSRKAPPAAH